MTKLVNKDFSSLLTGKTAVFAALIGILACGILFCVLPAFADTSSFQTSHFLNDTQWTPPGTSKETMPIEEQSTSNPFSLSASQFLSGGGLNQGYSGLLGAQDDDRTTAEEAQLERAQRMTALLVDGAYDFNYDSATSSSPLHPYLAGGFGLAMIAQNGNTPSFASAGTQTVPVANLGGGVAYRLDEGWDLALDYKAGFSGSESAADQFITDRGQHPIDLQSLNMGMKYKF
jgi:hypothetical protein